MSNRSIVREVTFSGTANSLRLRACLNGTSSSSASSGCAAWYASKPATPRAVMRDISAFVSSRYRKSSLDLPAFFDSRSCSVMPLSRAARSCATKSWMTPETSDMSGLLSGPFAALAIHFLFDRCVDLAR